MQVFADKLENDLHVALDIGSIGMTWGYTISRILPSNDVRLCRMSERKVGLY